MQKLFSPSKISSMVLKKGSFCPVKYARPTKGAKALTSFSVHNVDRCPNTGGKGQKWNLSENLYGPTGVNK